MVTIECAQCGRSFEAWASRTSRTHTNYCSRQCHYDSKRRPLSDRFWELVDKRQGDSCWEWTGERSPFGYGRIKQHNKGEVRRFMAHRLSWEIHHGPIPNGQLVLHRCDNPPCVRSDHLFLGSPLDNMIDRSQKGRAPTGVKSGAYTKPERVVKGGAHYRTHLTENDVLDIRARYAKGSATLTELAREHRANIGTVWSIVNRRNWRHI